MELNVVERQDELTQVELIGRLDIKSMQGVDVKFHGYTAGAGKPAIVDLSKLEFLASLGLGMLISCAQSLQRKGAKMILLGAQGMVLDTLRTSGLDQAIPMASTLAEAEQLARVK